MARLSYDSVEALIYDPVSANRTTTRAALYSLGFRRTESVSTFDGFVETVQKRPPDIVLCEAQGAGEELCAAIQQLRQGGAGENPFIVIIVTAWDQSSALVSRVLNSGADDLLLRPFSTATLNTRIRSHIERRKGFVITSDYVGPDRRRDSVRPSDIELFDPPNSLRMKAQERMTSEEAAQRLDQELKKARDVLTTEKLRRDAFQVCVLWRLMHGRNPASSLFDVDLSKLKDKAKAISRRCLDTEFEPAIAWCDSILAAVEGLEAGVDRNASMHLLGHAALNLTETFSPEKSEQEHLEAVDATVALVKARTATKLAS